MVRELGRANSFAKKLPKRVIFAGHLVDNSPASHRNANAALFVVGVDRLRMSSSLWQGRSARLRDQIRNATAPYSKGQ